jgi:hypothetical protein
MKSKESKHFGIRILERRNSFFFIETDPDAETLAKQKLPVLLALCD